MADDPTSDPPTQESKRVSFSEDTKQDAGDGFRPVKKGKKATRSATVGKADPVRDLGIFLGILAFVYYVSVQFQDIGKMEMEDEVEIVKEIQKGGNSLSRLKKMRQALGTLLSEKLESFPVRTDCDLFLAPSSIPQTGPGIFAGKNYTTGEEIMLLSPNLLLLEGSNLWITSEGLLLKHHPRLANVKPSRQLWKHWTGDEGPIQLVATQRIIAGQELLLDFNQHLHSVMPEWFEGGIPTLQNYEEADSLIREVRDTFREPKGPRGRKATYQQQQTGVVGQGLRMIQRVVARYRPVVAKLMPIALESLSKYQGQASAVTSLYLGLHNQTSTLLSRTGLCVTDIKEENNALVTRRNVTQGHRVHPLPVFIRAKTSDCVSAKGEEESCNASTITSRCWSRPDLSLEFCPLLPLPDSFQIVSTNDEANSASVELRKSDGIPGAPDLSKIREQAFSIESIVTWELVAINDMTEGGKLVLALERDGTTGEWVVPHSLLPQEWMETS